MQTLTGQLLQNGLVVADGVRGNFEVEVQRDGTERWSGYFILPPGITVNNGQHYDLALNDGRAKQIEINRVNAYPTQTTVSFGSPN